MKTIVRIAALSGTLFLGGLAHGQETAPTPATKPAPAAAPAKQTVQPGAIPATAAQARPADGWHGIPLGMLIKQVGLTPEQTQQGKELNAKYMKLYQGLDANMPLEERKVKVKGLMDQREVELKAILTPEQQKQYASMQMPNGQMNKEMQAPADGKMQPKPATTPAPAPEKKSEK
jgi:hypothetical protein